MVLLRYRRKVSRSKPKSCSVAIYSQRSLGYLPATISYIHARDRLWGDLGQRPADGGPWLGACQGPSLPGCLLLRGQSPGTDARGVGKGQDLWHFPSSWKQRQIPVSSSSNPVPPTRVAGAEGNPAGLWPHPATQTLFQTIFPSWGRDQFSNPEDPLLVQILSPPHWGWSL